MAETRELKSVVDAAEQAALAGDYLAAERHLREAAFLQEACLGPQHPDLANTLNNLGVVCERIGKSDEAERSFRRACAIATATLDPEHPFVATSRQNLEDFCRARGKTVDLPTPRAAPPAEPVVKSAVAAERPRPRSARPVMSRSRWRPGVKGALILGGAFVVLLAALVWVRSNDGTASMSAGASVPTSGSAATPAEVRTDQPLVTAVPADTATAGSEGARAGETTAAAPVTPAADVPAPSTPPIKIGEDRAGGSASPQAPLVAEAQLCQSLSTASRGGPGEWLCDPPDVPVARGPLYYYTRVRSPTDTTVQHRWYVGDSLRQVVELGVRANATRGYRTYSRYTIADQGAGDWRVELRTRDGVVLHEERFVVQ